MLDLIRRKQKSKIIQIVFWALIATFVGAIFLWWGAGGSGKGKNGGGVGPALTINDVSVPMEEYRNNYRLLHNLYSSIYGNSFSPQLEKELKLREQALERVINQQLLLEQADKLGLKLDKDALVQRIAQNTAFQVDGTFNRDRYVQVLNYQRISVKDFEQSMTRELLAEKVQQQLTAGLDVSDTELIEAYHRENDKVSLQFVQLAPALFENKVQADETGLTAYFQAQQEAFRLPERIALRYLRFEPSRYTPAVETLNDDDLDRYYRRNIDRFEIEEQLRASHILIRLPDGADDAVREQKKQRAQALLEELRAGKDFAELARTTSDDTASAAKGGDLGFFPRGAMVEEFERAAFALQPGELSEVVETPFGYHLIKVTGHVDAGAKPLVDVIDQVRQGLQAEKAQQRALEVAMDSYNVNRRSGDLDAAAKTADLTIEETPLFGRDDAIGSLGSIPDLAAAGFALQPNELTRPVTLADGTVVLAALKERQPSRLPELAEVRTQVEQAWRRQQATELAQNKAQQLLGKLRQGGNLAKIAEAEKLTVESTGPFTRAFGDFVPHLGSAPELAAAAFTLTSDKPFADQVFELNGKLVVAALQEQLPADEALLDEAARATLKQKQLGRKRQEVLEARLRELRDQADIRIGAQLQDFITAGK